MGPYFVVFEELRANYLTEKYILALKCLLAAAGLDPEHPKVHQNIIRFSQAIEKDKESISPKSFEVIKSDFTLLPSGKSFTQFNDEYLAKSKDHVRGTLAGLQMRKSLSPESSPSCEKDILGLLDVPHITLREATEALEVLKSWNSSQAESFRSKAATIWPKAVAFASSE